MNDMKVILLKSVPKLGNNGDVKEVSEGYARNFLIPQNLACLYSKKNEQEVEMRKKKLEKAKLDVVRNKKALKDRKNRKK
jgi:large subunit ribosomal protein L9